MALRPYWSGTIRLSLVSLPVNLFGALNRSRQIAFHEIYRKTGERVHHELVAGEKTIDRDEVVKGYEVEKGAYVLIEPDDLKKLKIPSSKTLDIVQFVDSDEIDDVYVESPYYVAPDGRRDDPTFAVIRDALRRSKKAGLGQLAIAGRERLCALKPYGSGMVLETLRYEDEIKDEDPYFEAIREGKAKDEETDLALELIRRKTAKFDPGKFHDHYRDAIRELIDARIEKRAPRPVVEAQPTGKVVNLMDALRQSLKEKAAGDAPAKKPPERKAAAHKSARGRKAG